MSAQEPMTWGQLLRIRFRHLWWVVVAQGVFILVLLQWGPGVGTFLLMGGIWTMSCLYLAWLYAKGIGVEPSKAWAFLVLAIPHALMSGFLCAYSFLFGA